MSYRTNPETVLDLVTENEAHKDLYINDEVFDLEIEHLFRNTWVYVGHGSQVPNKGDYFTTTIANQPLIMVRHSDDTIKILENRCAHRRQITGRSERLSVIFSLGGLIHPFPLGPVKGHFLPIECEEILPKKLPHPNEEVSKATHHRKIAPNGILRLVGVDQIQQHQRQNPEANGQNE